MSDRLRLGRRPRADTPVDATMAEPDWLPTDRGFEHFDGSGHVTGPWPADDVALLEGESAT